MSNNTNHHRHQRPLRLSVPPRFPNQTTAATTSRHYPSYPSYPSPFSFSPSTSTPLPTPSKRRSTTTTTTKPNSLSSLFLLLFSLSSLYSLLPFLRTYPSFSLFPFSFLVTLSSSLFFLAYSFDQHQQQPPLSLSFSQRGHLFVKAVLLTFVFLLRFQALRSCGTASTILADFSGGLAAKFFSEKPSFRNSNCPAKVRGFSALLLALFLLSLGWDRSVCFPFHALNLGHCVRVLPMMLPFLSGFLGFYERSSANWGSLRQLGKRRVRLISLCISTAILFPPAIFSFVIGGLGSDIDSVRSLVWPLLSTVVFGVVLSESCTDDRLVSSYSQRCLSQREFLIIFSCTCVLELFYFPELSLLGLLFCGFLFWISVRELGSPSFSYPELGSDSSESLSSLIMNPLRHILKERKSRKIALFLFINTAYMVVEFVAGFMSNSLGLISDACHMLFDCAALAIGLYASYISRLPANAQFNYGRGRFEVLSGYVNAVFLVLVGALIVLESLERILDPQEISTNSLLTVSIGGLLVNVVGLLFFHEEHHHAHGGAGTCFHSHSHSQSHSHSHHHHHHHHHSYDHCSHDSSHHGSSLSHSHSCTIKTSAGDSNSQVHVSSDKPHSEHHQCISVSSELLTHEKSSAGHDHHDHDQETHDHHDHGHACAWKGHSEQGLKNTNHHCNQHDHPKSDQEKHHHHVSTHSHDRDNPEHNRENQNIGRNGSHNDHHEHRQMGALRNSHDHVHCIDHHVHESMGHRCSDSMLEKHSCTVSKMSHTSSQGKLQGEPRKHHHIDHNMEGIFLHVLADTMGSVGVVISTLLIKYKGWLVADPACSIFISVLIVSSVIPLLRNSAEVLLQRIPRFQEQDLEQAFNDVSRIKGVHDIQDVHVWSFTNKDVVGTLHLHISADSDKASLKEQVSHILNDAGVKDLTVQVEYVGG